MSILSSGSSFLLLGAFVISTIPTLAHAQVRTYGASLSDDESRRLRARTADESASDPVPTDPLAIALELALVRDQRNAIDIAGITALQWTGAVIMISGAIAAVLGETYGTLLYAGGYGEAFLAETLGGGWAGLVLGSLILGLCELDGNLHRRRAVDGRIRRLRRAEPDAARATWPGLHRHRQLDGRMRRQRGAERAAARASRPGFSLSAAGAAMSVTVPF